MFYGFVITEAGNALLASMVAGQTLTITGVTMDKGTAESAEAARQLTAPIDPGPDGTSTVPTVDGNAVNMIVEYRSDLNGGLQEGFWIGGFSIFGKVGDGEETMIGYGTVVGERGVTLSGGQKQRVSIARTLLRKTPYIIFDDSLSAVDSDTDAAIRARLAEEFGGATVILISHRITTVMNADNIIVMEDGEIAEQGSGKELMERDGIYKRIYDMQMSLPEDIKREVQNG